MRDGCGMWLVGGWSGRLGAGALDLQLPENAKIAKALAVELVIWIIEI